MVDLAENKTPREIRRSIFNLAWPAVLRMFLQSIVGVIDVIMIGSLGATAIAAVDMSNRLIMVIIGAMTALTIGATALVAQSIGAKDKKKSNKIMVNSLLTGVFLAIILAILGVIFSTDFLKAMMVLMEEVDNNVLTQGSIYLKIVFASMVFGLPMMIINAVLQGIGDMKTPLYIMLITNVCNTVFNYLLIFGIGIFPELGVAGAALGTAFSRVVGTIIGFSILVKGKTDMKLSLDKATLKLERDIIKDIFDIGVPAAIEQLVRQSSQIVYTLLVAGLGTITIAANAIVMNAQMVPIMIGFGFSTAATTLVGQSLGADKQDLAKRYGRETAYLSMLLMIVISIPMFIWVDTIIGLFTSNPDVVSLVKPVLKIMIFIQPIFSIMMVLTGALRGAGDTKWTMYIAVAGNWLTRLILSLVLGYSLGYGLLGFWLAMGIDVLVRTGLIIWRYSSDKWQYSQRVKAERKAA